MFNNFTFFCTVTGNSLLPNCEKLAEPGTPMGDDCIRIGIPMPDSKLQNSTDVEFFYIYIYIYM